MMQDTRAAGGQYPFYYAEECGLALLKDARTGKKFYVEREVWTDLVASIRDGWHPGAH